MKVTDEQKKELAEIISVYDEVCLWKYSSAEQRKEMLNAGELPPTPEPITEKMLLDRIVGIVEVQPNE